MPRIAEQHLPGGWRSSGENAHTPTHAWPDDCYVQWGASGIVLSKTGARKTAFFEAFPTAPKTFIRGEGNTVAEAEAAAFAKYERQTACPGHEFERGSYRNGAGICKHCRMFSSEVFEPLETCVVCGKPTYYTYGVDAQGISHWYCEQHEDQRCRETHPNAYDKLLADEAQSEAPSVGRTEG